MMVDKERKELYQAPPTLQVDALHYALFLCRGHSGTSKATRESEPDVGSRVLVLDEAVTPDFEYQIQNGSARAPKDGGAHVRVILMNSDAGIFVEDRRQTYALFEKHWGINMEDVTMLSSRLVSSYHSRTVSIDGELCLEICYNISEFLSYASHEISSLDSNLTVNVSKSSDMRVQHQYEPLYCRHNLATGQTTYIVLNANRENRFLLHNIGEHVAETSIKMHPLTMQTVIIFHALATRTTEIDDLFRRLLWIENQIYQGSIFDGTNAETFTRYIQLSHKMSRNLITLEHRNHRDASHINRLLGDHERLWKLTRHYATAERQIDSSMHEHVRDSLLCLRDFAEDRERQILNLQRKTQNFITLLYHLITGHDSTINLRIAAQTASVAHESKKDSTSMKIIAGVTMFYLPATFVCSLFGTNLVALNTNDAEPTFVVSPLWWLYIVFAVPLTALTISGFVLWRRWREGYRIQNVNTVSV